LPSSLGGYNGGLHDRFRETAQPEEPAVRGFLLTGSGAYSGRAAATPVTGREGRVTSRAGAGVDYWTRAAGATIPNTLVVVADNTQPGRVVVGDWVVVDVAVAVVLLGVGWAE
jgi:hypothetical protein